MLSSLQNVLGSSFMFYLGIILTALYGLCVGSYLNVLIFRIPEHMSTIKTNSHCFSCNNKIKWYDNIPLVSYTILRGRCRYCNSKISIQYPIIEFLNALLWEFIFIKFQFRLETLIYFALVSALLSLSVIDEKTYEIPVCFNYFILSLGVIYTIYDYKNIIIHILGMISVSAFLFLVWILTHGNGMGFGDVKLMFTCGLVLGIKLIVPAFLIGCILSIIIHTIRMKISRKSNKLAFGPYLSLGIFISLFVGEYLSNFYLRLIGVL